MPSQLSALVSKTHPGVPLDAFPPPLVNLAVGGVLDPELVPPGGCPLIVPYTQTLDRDRVTYRWSSSVAGGSHMEFRNLTAATAGEEVEFLVYKQFITANRYRHVTVDYYITRAGAIIGYSEPLVLLIGDVSLAFNPPRLDGVENAVMDLAVIPRDLEACLAATDYPLQVGDSGEVRVTVAPGGGTASVPFRIEEGQAGRDKWVTLPRAVFLANVGREVRLDCTVLRVDGRREESRVAEFEVHHSIGTGRLQVMGARSRGNRHFLSGGDFWLTALDANTLQPIEARWRYNHETTVVSGLRFRDTQPDRPLHVQVDDDWVAIHQRNLVGNGNLISGMVANNAAFAARADLGNLVAWGNPGRGGNLGATLPTLTDIVALSLCGYAFSARRNNDSVVAWGYEPNGGLVPAEIAEWRDVVALTGNGYAFTALRSNGSVGAWGSSHFGASVPDEIKNLTNIKTVVGSLYGFAALLTDGSVVAWGNNSTGSTVPEDIAALTDIVELTGNDAAFAARRANGSVVAWGNNNGGSIPQPIKDMDDIVEVSSTRYAFAARRADGSVVAWGNANHGGSAPDTIKNLTDVVAVTGNVSAFVAQRADGSVRAWGIAGTGGTLPAPIAERTDIVQVVPAVHAFAALCADGTVMAWGNATYGGEIPESIQPQLSDVRAICGNTHAFAALTADGRVVTWGAALAGGDSDAVADKLNGKISYTIAPDTTRATVSTRLPRVATVDMAATVAK